MMMITSSKKNKTTVTTTPQASNTFDVLPLDLIIEILGRLPVKSIARFLLVSKSWATIIRSRDFIKSFPLGSCSPKPQFLIAFRRVDKEEPWYFFSSSFLSRSCPIPIYDYRRKKYPTHYVNGLLSIGCGQEQFIVNPTTGKSIASPRVRTKRIVARSFFGYDSANDKYKILCMTEALKGRNSREPPSQHQVFTLGAKKKSWRMVECCIPHRPSWSSSVIYYAARTGKQCSLMRFDLRSEKFDLITKVTAEIVLSEDQYTQVVILNYQGEVAIPIRTSTYTFEVWVLDQNAEEHKWLKKLTFSVEPWKYLFRFISIKGITRTGELILTPCPYYYKSDDDVYVFLYNHYTDTLRKIKVEGNADYNFKHNHVTGILFSDYIESVRFL